MDTDEIINNVVLEEHGFQHILSASDQIMDRCSSKECFDIAINLMGDGSYQKRMLSTVLLGHIAVNDKIALSLLKDKVSNDSNWRVQEMLAKSFDHICKERGYEASLPLIYEWIDDSRPKVVRAVTEGLRIWTSRPYFKDHPTDAIILLSKHKSDPSEYVRKSVGNALRDISKKYPQLVLNELATWDHDDSKTHLTYKLATKYILKSE